MTRPILHHHLHQAAHQAALHHGIARNTAIQNTRRTSLLLLFQNAAEKPQVELLVKSLLVPADPGSEGEQVRGVAVPWFMFTEMIRRDPLSIYGIDPRVWEELVAGVYEQAGYEVVLTPRSGDFGRDVVATKRGVGSIRIFDQVKVQARQRCNG